jgi:SAM-dependent methyltransferase
MRFSHSLICLPAHGTPEEGETVKNTISAVCPWCNSSSPILQYSLVGGKIYTCTFCGIGFVHPLPSNESLGNYYNDEYHITLEKYLPAYRKRANQKFSNLCKLIERKIKPGTLLEIGSSYGLFMDAARSRGWKVAGIELDAHACRLCKEILDLDVYCGTPKQFSTEKKFDLICLLHTIEHDPDCFATLKRIKDLLAENGLLVLTLPNFESLASRFNGPHWEWMIPPAHLFYFNPSTIMQVLSGLGYVQIETFTRRGDARNLIMEAVVGMLKRTVFGRWVRRICARPISIINNKRTGDYIDRLHPAYRLFEICTDSVFWLLRPAFLLLYRLGLGEEILVFARNHSSQELGVKNTR